MKIEIRRREDGQITIGEKTVAELVREHRFEPRSFTYLIGREKGPCGCGIGLICLAAGAEPVNYREMPEMMTPYTFTELKAGLPADLARAFEDGWMYPKDEPIEEYYDADYVRLGREARHQANAAWAELTAAAK